MLTKSKILAPYFCGRPTVPYASTASPASNMSINIKVSIEPDKTESSKTEILDRKKAYGKMSYRRKTQKKKIRTGLGLIYILDHYIKYFSTYLQPEHAANFRTT